MAVKRAFYLEEERITLKRAKAILGEKRYKHIVGKARKVYLETGEDESHWATEEGPLTLILHAD